MKYTTYKSKHERQGIPSFMDNGKKRFVSFERHTLLVGEDDKALKDVLDSMMEREKELSLPRTIFTPEEFTEFSNPDMAFLEHKEKGKIPLKTVYKMIDYALENGFKEEKDVPVIPKKVKVEQGTKFTSNQIKENQ